MNVRSLRPEDAEEYVEIRREALLQEPQSFASSPEDDKSSSVEFVRSALADSGQTILGAFSPDLIGVVGIYRDRHVKASHKAHIWGMYVSPAGRGSGVGRRLMESAIRWARDQGEVTHIHLVVSSRTPIAKKLYLSLGFHVWR